MNTRVPCVIHVISLWHLCCIIWFWLWNLTHYLMCYRVSEPSPGYGSFVCHSHTRSTDVRASTIISGVRRIGATWLLRWTVTCTPKAKNTSISKLNTSKEHTIMTGSSWMQQPGCSSTIAMLGLAGRQARTCPPTRGCAQQKCGCYNQLSRLTRPILQDAPANITGGQ